MTAFVIDASIVIKWVVAEAGSVTALALRRHRLVAPDLLTMECANILWKKVRRGEMTAPEATVAAGLLARAGIELVPMRDLLAPALALAIRLDHPAHDCAYLALGSAMGCDVVTADESMVRKVAVANLGIRVVTLDAATQ